MIDDEPAFAAKLSPHKLHRVTIAAKGICQSRLGDDDELYSCEECDTVKGGSCVAFGIWGDIALAAVEALDADTLASIQGAK
jgi:hypothetical protein